MASSFTRILQRYRVFSGFLVALAFLVFSRPTPVLLYSGLAVAALGALIRAWAAGTIRKERLLETEGPYAFTRNPLYFGTLLIVSGFALASGVWWVALLSLAYFASIYLPVMNVEADELRSVFADQYEAYAKAVPLLFPRLTPWKKSTRAFDFGLYFKNGEYNALLGILAGAALLAVKAFSLLNR